MSQGISGVESSIASQLYNLFNQVGSSDASQIAENDFDVTVGGESTDQTATVSGDSIGSGSATLSAGDLASAFQQLDSDLQSILVEAQQNADASDDSTGTSSSSGAASAGGAAGLSQIFTSLDTNGDGEVSESEFVAGRPTGVSADQATALFEKLDTSGSGNLTEAQFVAGMEANSPVSGSSSDGSADSGASVIADDVLKLLQDVVASVNARESSDATSATSTTLTSGSTGTSDATATGDTSTTSVNTTGSTTNTSASGGTSTDSAPPTDLQLAFAQNLWQAISAYQSTASSTTATTSGVSVAA